MLKTLFKRSYRLSKPRASIISNGCTRFAMQRYIYPIHMRNFSSDTPSAIRFFETSKGNSIYLVSATIQSEEAIDLLEDVQPTHFLYYDDLVNRDHQGDGLRMPIVDALEKAEEMGITVVTPVPPAKAQAAQSIKQLKTETGKKKENESGATDSALPNDAKEKIMEMLSAHAQENDSKVIDADFIDAPAVTFRDYFLLTKWLYVYVLPKLLKKTLHTRFMDADSIMAELEVMNTQYPIVLRQGIWARNLGVKAKLRELLHMPEEQFDEPKVIVVMGLVPPYDDALEASLAREYQGEGYTAEELETHKLIRKNKGSQRDLQVKIIFVWALINTIVIFLYMKRQNEETTEKEKEDHLQRRKNKNRSSSSDSDSDSADYNSDSSFSSNSNSSYSSDSSYASGSNSTVRSSDGIPGRRERSSSYQDTRDTRSRTRSGERGAVREDPSTSRSSRRNQWGDKDTTSGNP